jgi:DNA-binding transcriptional MerR regulator/methylmalonyl-CoA mutase cobalamin-binding subunit
MAVTVGGIESATGINKEVIRKWEIRHGFPRPLRDAAGDRLYPDDQVASLRLIRRLIDAGMRPSKVVGLAHAELEELAAGLSQPKAPAADPFREAVLAAIRGHDPDALRAELNRRLTLRGLLAFVQDDVAALNNVVGEHWLHGRMRVFEEHLYTEVMQDTLRLAATMMPAAGKGPAILLTTPPNELHTLGLAMAKLVIGMAGGRCISLGGQTPVAEICDAVEDMDIQVVALSFSVAHPRRRSVAFLRELRASLRPRTAIWAGGTGSSRLPADIPGVTPTVSFDAARAALASWI